MHFHTYDKRAPWYYKRKIFVFLMLSSVKLFWHTLTFLLHCIFTFSSRAMTHVIFFVCLFIHLAFGCQNTRLLAKKDYSFSLFQFRRNVYRVRMNLWLCRIFFLCAPTFIYFFRDPFPLGALNLLYRIHF